MATSIELTISLAVELGSVIEDSVARGEYVDTGDYVCDLQRLADDDAIRTALEHGERSERLADAA